MNIKNIFIAFGIWILGLSYSFAGSCTAIASGNWYDPTIWSCGIVPGCGDLVTIPSGFTVNIDSHVMIDESSMPACNTPTYIQVFGTLRFVTGKKMELACGSAVEIMVGGLLQNGGGGGSSNWLKICGVTEWQSSDGNVPGYHLFGPPIPLPASLLSFETENIGASSVAVSWLLASERSVDHYRIDFSLNGFDWETVGNVASRGDHSSTIRYSTTVASASVGTGYFRLISIDADGTNAELSLKSHEFVNVTEVTAYPNPVKSGDMIHIHFGYELNVETTYELVDLNGRTVESGRISQGESSTVLETSAFGQGVYMIHFADANLQRLRIVVE